MEDIPKGINYKFIFEKKIYKEYFSKNKNILNKVKKEYNAILYKKFAITNPFYSLKLHHSNLEDVLVIALSVSGETEEVLTLVQGFKERNAKIVSLTNTDISTLSQLSDINLSYFMPVAYADSSLRSTNLTTQIPVVYFLESLRYQVYLKK